MDVNRGLQRLHLSKLAESFLIGRVEDVVQFSQRSACRPEQQLTGLVHLVVGKMIKPHQERVD